MKLAIAVKPKPREEDAEQCDVSEASEPETPTEAEDLKKKMLETVGKKMLKSKRDVQKTMIQKMI